MAFLSTFNEVKRHGFILTRYFLSVVAVAATALAMGANLSVIYKIGYHFYNSIYLTHAVMYLAFVTTKQDSSCNSLRMTALRSPPWLYLCSLATS